MPRPALRALRPLAAAASFAACAALLALAPPGALAAQTFYGPTPYLGAADSPFGAVAFAWLHRETFEDGLLNTPGVTLAPGPVVLGPAPLTDSVDEDDGAIDGSGTRGHSLFTSLTRSDLVFDFDPIALGGLPTHVGIVWTDVGTVTSGALATGPVTFEAFGPGLVPLGSVGPLTLGDGALDGTTAEDRFFGVANAGGIARIRLVMANSTDWEADHLQYGRVASTGVVPEPASLALVATGLTALGALRVRRRPSARRAPRRADR